MKQKSNMTRLSAGMAWIILLLAFASASPVAAVSINPGDILITDHSRRVIRVDPVTGAQTTVSSGGNFHNPNGIVIGPTGDILVVDHVGGGQGGSVIRIDPTTGAQTVVSTGGSFRDPVDIAIAPNGDILVADNSGAVIRVDATTGAQTTVSSGGYFVNPSGIAIAPNGDIFVAESTAGAVIRVDPMTGVQAIVSAGGYFLGPHRIAVAANGDLLVTDPAPFPGAVGVIRVDSVTGAQTVVSSGGIFEQPLGVAIALNGDIFVADWMAIGGPAVIRVDPLTGAQTIVSSGGSFVFGPIGIAIASGARHVAIDIKPGSFPNSINLFSGGNVAVAILSAASFDATSVDPLTVTLADATVGLKGKGTPMASFQDVNGDGLLDLVVHVSTEALQLSDGDTAAVLEARTYGGTLVTGTDSVRIVP